MSNIILSAFTIITVLNLFLALFTDHSRPFLIAASTGFVLIALTTFLKNKSRYGIFIVIALIFCWLGDFLGRYNFIASLLAFLVAHLVLITAFIYHGLNKKGFFVSLGIFVVVSAVIFRWLYQFIPDSDKIFVFSYMIVITVMVIMALGTRPSGSQIIISLGAIFFYVSDIFVAKWKFVDQSSINAFFCYPIYYTSCLLFAFSILAYRIKNGENTETQRHGEGNN